MFRNLPKETTWTDRAGHNIIREAAEDEKAEIGVKDSELCGAKFDVQQKKGLRHFEVFTNFT